MIRSDNDKEDFKYRNKTASVPWSLRSRHADSAWTLHLLRLLHQRARIAEYNSEQVSAATTLDVPTLSDLATHAHQSDQVQYGHEVSQATQKTVLAHRLGVLAKRVARHKVGDEAQAKVVEAAEETMLEFTHCVGRSRFVQLLVTDLHVQKTKEDIVNSYEPFPINNGLQNDID
ncbi:hypothetical protein ElyMa_006131900 [Elysia marginata]|uniref:Uncharacterized protein n=1 Tax=Elysia marginata TaxID=1093978 RepID=A0AAV4GWC9_9GAST|nr:hypothetical protein ElyMa_006131900 [Elysia marginata]